MSSHADNGNSTRQVQMLVEHQKAPVCPPTLDRLRIILELQSVNKAHVFMLGSITASCASLVFKEYQKNLGMPATD